MAVGVGPVAEPESPAHLEVGDLVEEVCNGRCPHLHGLRSVVLNPVVVEAEVVPRFRLAVLERTLRESDRRLIAHGGHYFLAAEPRTDTDRHPLRISLGADECCTADCVLHEDVRI